MLALALALVGCGGAASEATPSDGTAGDSEATTSQQGQAVVKINTEGVGEIAWAYEDDEPEFDDEFPTQSAFVGDAYGQTIHIEARESDDVEGFRFVRWNKDGVSFSTDRRIDVKVDGDAEYVALFEYVDESGEVSLMVSYGDSEMYTAEDIDAALDVVMAEFNTWTGAKMKRITFTNDETCAADLDYCNSLREDGEPEYTQAMVIMSDFHSPSGADAEGTAWEPDTDYNDYSWHLARTDGGEWHLLTWGY